MAGMEKIRFGGPMIQEYTSQSDYDMLLEQSKEKPVFILKHSTICPVSSSAHKQFLSFVDDNDAARFWIVLVREQRSLSLDIAERSGIQHQSPQVILFSQGKPVWNCSHHQITEMNLTQAMGRE